MRPSTRRRIDRVLKALERIDKLVAMGLDELLENELEPLLEREVEVVIQGLLDIGEFIISYKGFEPPSKYSDVGRILAKHNVLDKESAETLVRLAKLRNIIVHLYADIDYELLFEHASQLRSDARNILHKLIDYIERNNIDP